MATTLFTQNESQTRRFRDGTDVAGIRIKVKESESHTYSAQVTQLAMESGAVISDHMILEPETVAVSFAMTNAGSGAGDARDVFSSFVELQKQRSVVELVTEHAVYSDMVCVSITPVHCAPYKGALNVTATFQKLYYVQLVSAGRAETIVKKKSAAGKMQAGTVEPVQVKKSGLLSSWEGLTNLSKK